MHTLDIKVGERFIIREHLWIYSHRANQNADLCFIDGAGNPERKTEQELMEMFSSREARHDPNYLGGRTRKTERLLQDIASFDPEHLAIAFDREIYVKAVIAAGIPSPQRETWPAIINNIPLPRSFSKPPSWHTVSDWVRAYRAAGKDVRAIVPAFSKRGRKQKERSEEERIFVGTFIKDWLRSEPLSFATRKTANLQIVCRSINQMKGAMPNDQFLELIEMIRRGPEMPQSNGLPLGASLNELLDQSKSTFN